MKKIKYYFNPKTLSYETYKRSGWIKLLTGLGVFSFSIILALIFFIVFNKFIDTPEEKVLKNQNTDLSAEIENMDRQLDVIASELDKLKNKDNDVYRSIYEVAPISDKLRQAGTGGTDQYKQLRKLAGGELLVAVKKRMDLLERQFDVQEKSFDDLLALAENKKDMLAHIPAIQPVANKKLERLASGFGYRIDPFYRTQKFHAGMDFTAPRGTEVYATADGVVTLVKSELWGYGQHIIISHGYSFETLYGHLSKFKVKVGQKVTRGQLIGLVGSTGKSTGPHLHYEVHKNGEPLNPAFFYHDDLTDEEYSKLLEIASSPNQSFD
ncbi:MAG: peptidoglycan DD-metalloendopeptidase family protein [Bacteroidia bacterium]|nr:peptidoglycan DD-metalloendopeptidase family protein [Bacteroidia bacterium]